MPEIETGSTASDPSIPKNGAPARGNPEEKKKSMLTELIDDESSLVRFIEQEVDFHVGETLRNYRRSQNAALAFVVVVAFIGLALVINSYSRIQHTQESDDRIRLLAAQFQAVMNASGYHEPATQLAGEKK